MLRTASWSRFFGFLQKNAELGEIAVDVVPEFRVLLAPLVDRGELGLLAEALQLADEHAFFTPIEPLPVRFANLCLHEMVHVHG